MSEGRCGYDFGPFRLDLLTHRLVRDGKPVALTPKAIDTLRVLLEHRNRVLDKDELMKALWPDSFVEEANLSQHVFVLRKALGNQPDGRPYIETIPKRGYRFAADVIEVGEQAGRDVSSFTKNPVADPVILGAMTGRSSQVAKRSSRFRWLPRATVLVVIILVAGVLYVRSLRQQRLNTLMTVVEAAADSRDFDAADARLQAAGIEPGDPRLGSMAARIVGSFSIDTKPPASVRVRRVRLGQQPPTSDPIDLGSSPVIDRGLVAGEYVVELEGTGLVPMQVPLTVQPGQHVRLDRHLVSMAPGRGDMVLVDGGEARLGENAIHVQTFLIDSHEVTNVEFQRFVAAGKYGDTAFWPDAMVIEGHESPRASALARFVDRTGLPGPRTWSNGRYPDGKADHPVVGVSWYEASAYAHWIGKELPTFEQWRRAALGGSASGFPWGPEVKMAELRANFGLVGTTPVGAHPGGLSPFGLSDMAGNAREWLRNEGTGARHPAAGASWLEPAYNFEHLEWFNASQASPGIGFRLVTSTADTRDVWGTATLLSPPGEPAGHAADDAWIRRPANDRAFESLSKLFNYDRHVPFDLKVIDSKNDDGVIVERLTFQSSPGTRVPALLLHGANSKSESGIVLLHSAGAKGKDLPNNVALAKLMARAGWSVVAIDLPYFGERATDLLTAFSDEEKHAQLYNQPGVYLAWMTQSVRDVGRASDLLVERTGVNADRIALVGASRGAIAATVAAAVDRRFSPVALLFAGHATPFELDHLEAVCPANYISRISPRPLLMLNSINDQSFPPKSAVRPLFALAGSPKDIIWTNGGHMVMTESDIASIMGWLRNKIR